MPYSYAEMKEHVLTDEGQRNFLKVRDHVYRILDEAGAIDMQHATKAVCVDSWSGLAYVDRMVELGEIREIRQERCAGQHRIFVKARR